MILITSIKVKCNENTNTNILLGFFFLFMADRTTMQFYESDNHCFPYFQSTIIMMTSNSYEVLKKYFSNI
jgi:hypothetical protein